MLISNIVTYCEFMPRLDSTRITMFVYLEDDTKMRIDGVMNWPIDIHKLDYATQEELIVGWQRYVAAFSPDIAREYAAK